MSDSHPEHAPRHSKKQGSIRCFLGLALTAPARETLSEAAAAWKRQPEAGAFRWIHPDNYHLTLAFLGQLPHSRIQQLTGLLARQCWLASKLAVEIDSLIGFPAQARSRYLVAQVKASPSVLEMHGGLQTLLGEHGFPTEQRSLRPHITLARLRREQVPPAIAPRPLELVYPVDRLILYASHSTPEGARYSALASFR